MMKHIYRDGYTTPPKNIYRCVDGQSVKVRKAWRAVSSTEYVKVWDISDNEYLKVSDNYVCQKFLERYYSQSIYTSVYWVHDVNGQKIQTYLSTSELNSWECETLTPYYFTDGDRQYVGYYQTPTNSGFGEHTMKITYKSPETGNILEIEYPIFYLQEKDLCLISQEMTWYPFRYLFAQPNSDILPTGYLHFECLDKNENPITYDLELTLPFTTTRYEFPAISNGAKYQFGEGQEIDLYYISVSYAKKEYHKTLILNIRHYYDKRNTATNSAKNSARKYNIRDLKPFSFTIDLYAPPFAYRNTGKSIDITSGYNIATGSINAVKFYGSNYATNTCAVNYNLYSADTNETLTPPVADIYSIFGMFPATDLEWGPIASEDGDGDIGKSLVNANMLTVSQYISKIEDLGCIEAVDRQKINISRLVQYTQNNLVTDTFLEAIGPVNNLDTISTWGYVYWGDGTFDRLVTGYRYMVNSDLFENGYDYSAKYNNTTYYLSSISNPKKLKNGYTLQDGTIQNNYEDTAPFAFNHVYDNLETVYNIETTNAIGYNLADDGTPYAKKFFTSIAGKPFIPVVDNINDWQIFVNRLKECQYKQGEGENASLDYIDVSNESDIALINDYCDVLPFVVSLSIGDTIRFRTAYDSNDALVNSGYKDILDYAGVSISSAFSHLKNLTLPRMENYNQSGYGFDLYQSAGTNSEYFAYTPYKLDSINFGNTAKEVRDIFRLSETQVLKMLKHDNRVAVYSVGNNGTGGLLYNSYIDLANTFTAVNLNCDVVSNTAISLTASTEYIYTKTWTVSNLDSTSCFAIITNTSSSEIVVNGHQSNNGATSSTTIAPNESATITVVPQIKTIDTSTNEITVYIYILSDSDGSCMIDLKTQN